MMEKLTITFKIPKAMQAKLQLQVIQDDYGMRGKSRWITEAIQEFLALPDYPTMVDIASDMEQLKVTTSVRLHPKLVSDIENAVIAVRKGYPSAEGVKSNIIRASIMQRLIRSQ